MVASVGAGWEMAGGGGGREGEGSELRDVQDNPSLSIKKIFRKSQIIFMEFDEFFS